MKCREFHQHFEDWLEEKAGGELVALLENHRATCPACRALVHRARKASRMLRLLAVDSPEPAPGFYTRLRAQIREQEEQERRWGPMEAWARRLAWGLSVAILILAIYLNTTAPKPAIPPLQTQWMEAAAEGQDVLAEPGTLENLDRNQVMISLVVERGR